MTTQSRRMLHTDKGTIEYTLVRKKVKNVNLRIKRDGSLWVSAANRVSLDFIEKFLLSKAEWVVQAQARTLERQQQQAQPCTMTDEQCMELFQSISDRIFPIFAPLLGQKPTLKIRLMKSRWGVCNPKKRTITLNKRLADMPLQAVEYVVLHEYVHFMHPNHQEGFHAQMKKLMPDYKQRSRLLKG